MGVETKGVHNQAECQGTGQNQETGEAPARRTRRLRERALPCKGRGQELSETLRYGFLC